MTDICLLIDRYLPDVIIGNINIVINNIINNIIINNTINNIINNTINTIMVFVPCLFFDFSLFFSIFGKKTSMLDFMF